MALTNSGSGTGATYISLKKGYWGKRVDDEGNWPEMTPEELEARRAELVITNALSRKRGGTGKNSDDMVWEKRYDTLSGIITNAYIEEGKFGPNLVMVLDDDGETYMAQLKADGILAESITKTLPNISIDEPVVMKAYINKKDRGALWIEQNGEGVKWAYTKDEPNGMPEPVEKKEKGKLVWDYSEQANFLYEKLEAWCSQFEGKVETATADDLIFD